MLFRISKVNFEQFLWLVLNSVTSFIFGIFIIKNLLKLSETDFGQYNLLLSLQALISLFYFGPLEQGLLRFYNEYHKNKYVFEFVNLIVRFILLGSFFVLTIVFFIKYTFLSSVFQFTYLRYSILNVILGVLFIIFYSWNIITTSLLNIIQKRKEIFFNSFLERSLSLVLLILISKNCDYDLTRSILVISIVLILVSFIKWRIFVKNIFLNKPEIKDLSVKYTDSAIISLKTLNRSLVKFMIPFIIWGLASWLQSNSDKWVISFHMSNDDVAHYSLYLSLVSYLIVVPINLLSQFAQPLIYNVDLDIDSTTRYRKKIMSFIMFVSVLTILFSVLISFFFGDKLVIYLSNSNYLKNIVYLPFICISVGIFQLAQNLTFYGMAIQKSSIYLAPKLISGFIAIILNIILIGKYEFLGLIFSNLIAAIILFTLIYFTNIKQKFVEV